MRKDVALGPSGSCFETAVGECKIAVYAEIETQELDLDDCFSSWVLLCLKSDLLLDFSVIKAVLILLHSDRVGTNICIVLWV